MEKGQLLSEDVHQKLIEEHGNDIRVGMGAEAIMELLSEIDLEKNLNELKEEIANTKSQAKNKRNVKTTLAMDAIKNVREMRREKQQFGEGSLYQKYMQAQTAETEANIAQRKASEEIS